MTSTLWILGGRNLDEVTRAGTSARRFAECFLVLSTLWCPASSTAHAQTLDDFRTSAAADGVNVIPFPDLRRDASSIAEEVERRKYEASKYNISVLEPQKHNLLTEIKKSQERIKQKEEEINKFKTDHPEGSAAPLVEELEDLKEALTDHQEAVTDLNEDTLEDAAEAWSRLWNSRAGLREIFEDVVDKLDDVMPSAGSYLGSSPSTEDTDKLKNYVGVIENEIEVQAKTHKEQEDGAKATEQKFVELLKKSEI